MGKVIQPETFVLRHVEYAWRSAETVPSVFSWQGSGELVSGFLSNQMRARQSCALQTR